MGWQLYLTHPSAPWLPAQPLNTVGAQTTVGGLICSHWLRLHALLLAQYEGRLQLTKEIEGIFIILPLPVQSELSPTAGPVSTPKRAPEAKTRAVSLEGQGHRCLTAPIRVRPLTPATYIHRMPSPQLVPGRRVDKGSGVRFCPWC